MRARTLLTQADGGQWRLVVSLPDGRRQLSLDEPAVGLLREGLGLGVGTVVPDAVVPVLAATGGARLPDQRDAEATVTAVPSGGGLDDGERAALADYLAAVRVDPGALALVERVVAESPVAGDVDRDTLAASATEGPGDDAGESSRTADDIGEASPTDENAGEADSTDENAGEPDPTDENAGEPERIADVPGTPDQSTDGDVGTRDPGEIPGIGDTRAESLAAGGFDTVASVAEAEPSDLAAVSGISDEMAAVAVEGARGLVGEEVPAAERLAARTGVDVDTFEGALGALAASGVAPSEAGPVLERLYGPSIVEVAGVTGKQAYYLWEAGYRSPAALAAADPGELEAVPYVGAKSAPELVAAARELLGEGADRESESW